jgi:phenylacetate-coenzyme A ligase PaaK-like adenylate-forming protein
MIANPFDLWADACTTIGAAANIWQAGAAGAAALHSRAREHQRALLAHTRRHSRWYAQHWLRVPPDAPLAALPPVTKAQLTAHFDRWATDGSITAASAAAFAADTTRIGADYLDRYALWQSSGTSGRIGTFVQPHEALSIYDALLAVRSGPTAAAAPWIPRLPGVLIAALDGHYAGVVTWRRMQRTMPWLAPELHALSVKRPLEELVAELNAIRPRFVASYPTVLRALADQAGAGRLRIAPSLLWSGGECLSPAARRAIEAAFGCELINDYGASECMSIGFECAHGQLHLNADWVVLEPVDRHYRPVPPGTASFTTLLTNLANPVQPIVRYDLGDSVTQSAAPCACGSPLPAFTVEGRAADVLTLARRDGSSATLFPLALQSVVEEASGDAAPLTLFQILQTAPDALRLRTGVLRARALTRAAEQARAALYEMLVAQGLDQVSVTLDSTPIARERGSGKLRQVVGLAKR